MSGSRTSQIAILILVGAISIAMLAASLPRLRASFAFLPVDTAISNYYVSGEIPTHQIPGLIERAREAIDIHDHYRYRNGLATLYYLRGQDMRSPTLERRPSFERAIEASKASVAMSPAQPAVWYRIAWINGLLSGGPEDVIPPLSMSIYTGRVEPTLFAGRLELGYLYLDGMDEEAMGLLRDQTLLSWRMRPGIVAGALSDNRIDWPRVQYLLQDHADQALGEMEASLAGTP